VGDAADNVGVSHLADGAAAAVTQGDGKLVVGRPVDDLGVAVAKFAPHRGARAVAACLILLFAGFLMAAFATWRYRDVGRELDAGVFTPAATGVVTTAGIITLLALIAVLVLI
jgi:putative membrane protein